MSLRISGKNLDIGESMRQHVEARVAAATDKYFDGAVRGSVTLEPEGSGFRSDCTLHLTSGVTIRAEGRAQEPYASFDRAAERIEKQLRRYKRRLKDHHAGRDAEAVDAGPVANYVIEAPDPDAEEHADFKPAIVAEASSRLSAFTISAAVAELDFTGAPVVVFRHAGSGRVNVVYRRGDGHIGWVDPGAEGPDGRAAGRR